MMIVAVVGLQRGLLVHKPSDHHRQRIANGQRKYPHGSDGLDDGLVTLGKVNQMPADDITDKHAAGIAHKNAGRPVFRPAQIKNQEPTDRTRQRGQAHDAQVIALQHTQHDQNHENRNGQHAGLAVHTVGHV